MLTLNPVFCSQNSVIAPPRQPKTSAEISQERTAEKAKEAKQKPAEERTVGDYLTIGLDTINGITQNAPVVYAHPAQKLNYLA